MAHTTLKSFIKPLFLNWNKYRPGQEIRGWSDKYQLNIFSGWNHFLNINGR